MPVKSGKRCEACDKALVLNNTRDLERKRFCSRSCQASCLNRRRDLTAFYTAGSTPEANAKKGRRGSEHSRWRPIGSRRITGHGYVEIKTADPDVWEYEHRVVAKSSVGQDTHHKNKVKTDNRQENLEPLSHSEHQRLHLKERYGAGCQ